MEVTHVQMVLFDRRTVGLTGDDVQCDARSSADIRCIPHGYSAERNDADVPTSADRHMPYLLAVL